MTKSILIVDDDKRLRELLEDYLSEKKFNVYLCDDFDSSKKILEYLIFDLIIVDRMMPSGDGINLIKIIKSINNTPVILLTAMGESENKIEGLKIGADDYLIKPFDSEILLFKIKTIFKRKISLKKATDNKVDYIFSSFRYNSKFRELQFKNDKPVTLSPKEGKLLTLLLDNMNDLTTREEALVKIWNDDNYFTSRSMDVYVTKIRKYLSKDPKIKIENIHGKGFKFSI